MQYSPVHHYAVKANYSRKCRIAGKLTRRAEAGAVPDEICLRHVEVLSPEAYVYDHFRGSPYSPTTGSSWLF